jgi:predicted GTPase
VGARMGPTCEHQCGGGRQSLSAAHFCRHRRAIDTSGLEPFSPAASLQARAAALTLGVLRRADAALVIFDARSAWGIQARQREAALCLACGDLALVNGSVEPAQH